MRKPLDATAVSTMVLLCLIWGLSQVATKIASDGISPVTQAAIRSGVATLLLLGWARLRGITLLARDGTLVPGVVAGLLFGAEFVLAVLAVVLREPGVVHLPLVMLAMLYQCVIVAFVSFLTWFWLMHSLSRITLVGVQFPYAALWCGGRRDPAG